MITPENDRGLRVTGFSIEECPYSVRLSSRERDILAFLKENYCNSSFFIPKSDMVRRIIVESEFDKDHRNLASLQTNLVNNILKDPGAFIALRRKYIVDEEEDERAFYGSQFVLFEVAVAVGMIKLEGDFRKFAQNSLKDPSEDMIQAFWMIDHSGLSQFIDNKVREVFKVDTEDEEVYLRGISEVYFHLYQLFGFLPSNEFLDKYQKTHKH